LIDLFVSHGSPTQYDRYSRLKNRHGWSFSTGRTTPFFIGFRPTSKTLHTLGQSSESTLSLRHWRQDLLVTGIVVALTKVRRGNELASEVIVYVVGSGGGRRVG
jgi:hypothetical protein